MNIFNINITVSDPSFLPLILGLPFVFLILSIICMWRIFSKAGEGGWKCLIPIYNMHILWKIAGRSFFGFLFIYLFFFAIGSGLLFLSTSAETNMAPIALIAGIVFTVVAIIYALVSIILFYDGLSKYFGHGVAFTFGLIFIPWLFLLILAFGKDKYIKPRASVLDEY